MNFIQYLADKIASSLSYYIRWNISQPYMIKDSPPNHIEDNSNLTTVKTSTVNIDNVDALIPIEDVPIILYNDYIDDAIKSYHDSLFILWRLPNQCATFAYFVSGSQHITNHLTCIKLMRKRNNVLIRYKDNIYEWQPQINTVYGPNNDILYHFRNRPLYIHSPHINIK